MAETVTQISRTEIPDYLRKFQEEILEPMEEEELERWGTCVVYSFSFQEGSAVSKDIFY